MKPPAAFLGGASIHPDRQPARMVEVAALPRTVPCVTVYADGLVNLNSEATGLFTPLGEHALFSPPKPHRLNAGNPRTPNLWEIVVGHGYKFSKRADRIGVVRFKAKVFPPPGRYLLTPIAGLIDRFTLVPVQ